MNYEAFEQENARLTAQNEAMRRALVTAEAFIADELETRENSFLPDFGEIGQGYIREAKQALEAVRMALKEGK